ncbi:hypothetical protein K2173_019575 [Erythroxylum novogranatense]|uniref:Uncharacterized protein n=1 Tax=Erythroxylum novogranatense TaxID=1862640 RepID=A0AAV8UF60_9ROSI|nr:hypothetical protein K2173_019575 [Erythroxylum novogranatense]
MKSQVEIISQTIVKPSSPTPIQLRHLHLSFLDQIMPTVFSPWLLTYLNSPSISNAERCERLRKSLSDTLTLFYPFAGRVRGNSHVDCNDEGVPFVEAKAKGTIQKILQNPCCNNFNHLIPLKINENSDLGAFVQITYFECGGMVVGLGLSHKIADASSAFRFLNAWGAIARGHSNSVIFPNFEAAKYFRPVDDLSGFDPWHDVVKNSHKIVSKRFMFDATSIKKLRDKYVKSCCNCWILS